MKKVLDYFLVSILTSIVVYVMVAGFMLLLSICAYIGLGISHRQFAPLGDWFVYDEFIRFFNGVAISIALMVGFSVYFNKGFRDDLYKQEGRDEQTTE